MRHIRTFSRYFPAYHPKAGEPTYFVEKFYNSLFDRNNLMDYPPGLDIDESVKEIKHHTIREGHNIKVGDTISFRVWSGKPYRSKQIIIAPDVEIKKAWQFDFIFNVGWYQQILNGVEREGVELTKQIATNDGLTLPDFLDWFNPTPNKKSIFSGQIICWNPKVEY
jgi:hypothetical protein